MMNYHNKVIDNNLLAAVNMIMAHFDKLEGKTTDLDQSGVTSTSQQLDFGMPLNFYENQGLYEAANKGKSVRRSHQVKSLYLIIHLLLLQPILMKL